MLIQAPRSIAQLQHFGVRLTNCCTLPQKSKDSSLCRNRLPYGRGSVTGVFYCEQAVFSDFRHSLIAVVQSSAL